MEIQLQLKSADVPSYFQDQRRHVEFEGFRAELFFDHDITVFVRRIGFNSPDERIKQLLKKFAFRYIGGASRICNSFK
jgi:hypothetical protein